MKDRGATEMHDNEREEISTVVTFGINHMKDVAKFLQKNDDTFLQSGFFFPSKEVNPKKDKMK